MSLAMLFLTAKSSRISLKTGSLLFLLLEDRLLTIPDKRNYNDDAGLLTAQKMAGIRISFQYPIAKDEIPSIHVMIVLRLLAKHKGCKEFTGYKEFNFYIW